MSKEIEEIFKELRGKVSLAEALSVGLHIISPKLSIKANETFRDFTDKEVICYIFCKVLGWRNSRLAKATNSINKDNITDATYRAIKKLKNPAPSNQ